MRLTTIICLFILGLSCSTTKNTMQGKLNGTWIPVHEEIGGTVLPKASFQTQKLVINESSYTFTAESVDKGDVKWSGNKMDIYGKEGVNKGRHFTAIYKFENDQLSICYNLKGDSYPESFETKGKPMFFLCSFTKQ